MAQPQVLILPAGLAIEDLKQIKSINAIVVVDISSAPHMDWSSEEGDVPVKTWEQLLEIKAHHEPSEPAAVAIQSFARLDGEFKSVDFTHQVFLLSHSKILNSECHRRGCQSNEINPEKPCIIYE